MQRPTGVTILAILAAIGGVLSIMAGLALMALSGTAASFAIPGLSGLAAILGFAAVTIGVLNLVFAYGAWGLKPWAWALGIGLEVASIILSILQFSSATAASQLISIAIAGAIIYYLWQPGIRRAFGQRG